MCGVCVGATWCVWGAAANSGQALEQERLSQRVWGGSGIPWGGAARGSFADRCLVRAEAGHNIGRLWDAVLVDGLTATAQRAETRRPTGHGDLVGYIVLVARALGPEAA